MSTLKNESQHPEHCQQHPAHLVLGACCRRALPKGDHCSLPKRAPVKAGGCQPAHGTQKQQQPHCVGSGPWGSSTQCCCGEKPSSCLQKIGTLCMFLDAGPCLRPASAIPEVQPLLAVLMCEELSTILILQDWKRWKFPG